MTDEAAKTAKVAIRVYTEQRPSGFWVVVRSEGLPSGSIDSEEGPFALFEDAERLARLRVDMVTEAARSVNAKNILVAEGDAGKA